MGKVGGRYVPAKALAVPSQSYVGRISRVLAFLKFGCEHILGNSVLLLQTLYSQWQVLAGGKQMIQQREGKPISYEVICLILGAGLINSCYPLAGSCP